MNIKIKKRNKLNYYESQWRKRSINKEKHNGYFTKKNSKINFMIINILKIIHSYILILKIPRCQTNVELSFHTPLREF